MARKSTILTKWYQDIWMPTAAAVYLVICLFDFVGMPILTAIHNSHIETLVISKLDEKDTSTYADDITKANQANRQWNPLTLLGGGMFHLAFGAILSGGAVTRGLAKKSEVEGYYSSQTSTPPNPTKDQ